MVRLWDCMALSLELGHAIFMNFVEGLRYLQHCQT